MEKVNMVLIGAPGSGKGTAAKRLKEDLGLLHISVGDVLRENVKNGTELGMRAKEQMESGGLVPDEIIIGMVKTLIDSSDTSNGMMFDGYPRTIAQAEALDEMLAEKGLQVDVALNIEVPFEEIEQRMANRRTCSVCGAIYSLDFNPPKVEGICDCGGELIQRADEKPEVVRERLATYKEQSEPLIGYYNQEGKLYLDYAGDYAGKTTHQVVDKFEEFVKNK